LPAFDRARGRRYIERRLFLERSQWWSAERVREFQWTELKKLLAHAFAYVPYLRRKYRAAGIALEDLRGWDDFRRLPPLTRAEVNAHGPDLCSTGYKGRLLPHATGGSTGAPTRFFRTYESYDWRTAAKDRAYSWGGWRLGEPAIYLWGAPVGTVSRRQAWKTRAYEAVQRQLIVNTFSQSEELWNTVQTTNPFSHLHAYPHSAFTSKEDPHSLLAVSQAQPHVHRQKTGTSPPCNRHIVAAVVSLPSSLYIGTPRLLLCFARVASRRFAPHDLE
jgi:phenylacetate-coenzyme A ligase PaaK-like adenylate-forming protein